MGDSVNNKRTSNYIVDFGTLFFRVLSHWRSIILWAVIFAAAFTALRTLTGGETAEEREKELENLTKIYQKAEDQLAAQESVETQLDSVRDYQQNSLYMQIDPREKHVRDTVLAIRLEKDGMLNSLDVLTSAYVYGLNLSAAAEELGVDFRYVDELVGWSIVDPRDGESISDSSEGIQFAGFRVLVIGDSDELTARITDLLEQEIKKMEKSLSESVAAHTIEPISERVYTRIDDDLLLRQTEVQKQVLSLQTNLENLETSFRDYVNSLKKELNFNDSDNRAFSVLTSQAQLKNLSDRLEARAGAQGGVSIVGIIKNFIIGCILGGILMAGLWILICIFGKGFEAADEFFTRYGLTRLGVYAPDRRELGLRRTKLDRAILSHVGDYTGLEEKKTTELAAATLGNLVGQGRRLLVTGTASAEKINALGRELTAQLPGREIIVAPDFLSDVKAIKALPDMDAVVLTEERRASAYERIDRELSTLDRLEKEVLGAFIV